MALFDPTTADPSADPSTGGFLGGLMSGLDRPEVSSLLSAMGQSLLTSPRQNPFANFGTALQQQSKAKDEQASRDALAAVLIRSGMSPAEAKAYAMNPVAAKLAVETQATQKGLDASRKASAIMNGADAGDTGASASPRAPAGPAAGATLNGNPTGGFVDTLFGVESGGNSNAKNPNSSATGAAQFTSGTWAQMMRQHPDLGLTPDGRTDPEQARRATIAYAQDNGKVLADAGHEVTPGNLYLGHFLGGSGAAQFLTGLKQNPDAPAASYADPASVAANKNIFFNRDGSYKTARDFYAERTSRFGQAPTQVASAAGTAPISPVTQSDVSPVGTSGLNPNRPVQVANSENEVQVLEGRMGMYPRDVYGITPDAKGQPATAPKVADARADMPAPDAKPAEFQIPGSSAAPRPAGTVFDDKGKALQQLSLINRALAVPNLPDETRKMLEGQREDAKAILKPTDNTRKLIDAGYQPGTPEFQDAARKLAFGEKDGEKLVSEYNQREQIADRLGLLPGSPERQRFTATGKFPGEEKPGLTAGDKQAIYKAEDAIPPLTSALDTLKRAKELNPQTYTGMTAGALGVVGTKVPGAGYLIDEKKAANTREFNQIMSMEAIKAMSSTLKGATTDREMDRFVEILGDPSTPPAIRERTIDRMTVLAQRQLDLAQGRVNDLRGGTYFKPRDGAQPGQGGQPAQRGQGAAPAGGQAGQGQAGQGQAPAVSFSADELEAEARRRGLIQ